MERDAILIKPHHLIDMIKLYGAGVEHFVPDTAFQHDFYRVANEVINDLNFLLRFTIGGDDICLPCNRYDGLKCTDPLTCVSGYLEKETYNRMLDTRIIQILKLSLEKSYSVRQLVTLFSEESNLICLVWIEEDDALTGKRDELFQRGCQKLMVKA